jgi:hypothetical protein
VYDYRIEKQRLAVTVTLVSSDTVRGHVFVQPDSYAALGHSGARGLFNGDETFFPLEQEDGGFLLIAKAHVMDVSGGNELVNDELRRIGAREAMVEIMLVSRVSYVGSVLLALPSDRPRLLDLLNEGRERFLTLYTSDGVRFVNRSLIERVRPLD